MWVYALSDHAIAEHLGSRIKNLRLRRNITQEALAQATALSLNSIKALEKGKAKLSTLVAVMRELGALEQIEQLLPSPKISPLQLARQKKRRQRARPEPGREASDTSDQDGSRW